MNTHDYNFTFMKVDLYARKKFKAEKDKFEVDQAFWRVLDKNHGIISVMQVRNPTWDQVWHHPLDVTRFPSSDKDSIQGISHKIKQQGGDWVTLSNTFVVTKIGTHFPIDRDGYLSSTNQLHNTAHIPWIKTLSQRSFPQKGPVDPVIGFFKVQL
jgi:hypothetical protein